MKSDTVLLALACVCVSAVLFELYKRWHDGLAIGYQKPAEHDRQLSILAADVHRVLALIDIPTKERVGYI